MEHTQCSKGPSESYTEQVHILTQQDINGYGRLFGGRLMEWIDITAAVAARRHSNHEVTTAAISQLNFSAPAYVNDTVILVADIVYTGKTSMDVRVRTYVEKLNGDRVLINTAYLVMVALDKDEKPTRVPKLDILSNIEKAEWDKAVKRHELYKQAMSEE